MFWRLRIQGIDCYLPLDSTPNRPSQARSADLFDQRYQIFSNWESMMLLQTAIAFVVFFVDIGIVMLGQRRETSRDGKEVGNSSALRSYMKQTY